MTIRCVCFDWGGVILKICRSWAQGCERAGLAVRGDPATPAWANVRKGASLEYQLGHLDDAAYFRRISEACDGLYTPEECEAIHHAWLIEEYPGVAGLIDDLHTSGVTTALLSNTNRAHWLRQFPASGPGAWPRFGAASTLGLRHASHLLGLAKPDAAIYRAFERQTHFHAGEILFFDDLTENVSTALSLGWNTVQIDHTGDTADQMRRELQRRRVL